MTELLTVQTGETIWEQETRIDSIAGSPLSEKGCDTVIHAGKEIFPHEPTVIYTSSGEAEQQTAKLLSKELGIKIKTENKLCEINYGLWQGLKVEEIKRRQPSLHKQWLESPGSVRPPGGETLEEAQERIFKAVEEIARREKKQTAILVLRPVALGLLRCKLENDPIEMLWQHVAQGFKWGIYNVECKANQLVVCEKEL